MNIRDGDEATPLHFAASRGHTETVTHLISNEDSDESNSSWTFSFWMVSQVKWLLRRGAKITHDKYGKTPMNDAAENEQLEVREYSQHIQIGPTQI